MTPLISFQIRNHDGQREVLEHTATITNASMISSTELSCALPQSPVGWGTPETGAAKPVYGMKVSVSNDGERFSESLFLTIYDSTCMACTTDANCRRKVILSY